MRKQYGTREQAKREIFARYASFIYMGSGRYGFGAASEYYFDKPLAGYTIERRRTGGPAGRDRQVAPRLCARGGQLATAGAPQPDPGPDGAQRLHLRGARPAVPGRTGRRRPPCGSEDRGPRGDRARAGRAAGARRRALRGGGPVPGQDTSALHGRSAGAEDRQRGPRERARRSTRSGIPAPEGSSRVRWWCWPTRTRAILAEVGGRQLYNLRSSRYSDYNRVTGSLRQPGSVMKPLVYLAAFRDGLTLDATVPDEPISVPIGSADARGQVDRQLRRQVQGSDPRSPGAGRVPQRGRGVDGQGHRHGEGPPDLPGAGLPHAAAPLHQHGARRVRGPLARAGRTPIGPWPRGCARSLT